MKLRAYALAAALLPAAAAAQSGPRSLALELGWAADSAAALGERAPVALAGSWWVGGELDATARLAWSSAPRTGGRAADAIYEAGVGLRYVVARWRAVRQLVGADVGVVQVARAGWLSDLGARLGVTLGVEALLQREIFLGVAVQASELVLPGGGGMGAGAWVRAGVYF